MAEFGSLFKQKRAELGITLQQAAEDLHLRQKYLTALEEGEFEKLPAEVYTIGFIRNYARYLGLDDETLVVSYKAQIEPREQSAPPVDKNSRIYIGAGLAVISLLVLLVIGFRIDFYRSSPDFRSEKNSERTVDPTIIPPPELPSETVHQPETAVETTVAEPPETAPPERLEINVKAVEKTWLYVIFDGMGKREMLLQPGESVSWVADETISLRLGNAAGIRLFYDGIELPPLGRSGEVLDKVISRENGDLKVREAGLNESEER